VLRLVAFSLLTLIAALSLSPAADPKSAQTWPQWRGPNRDCIAPAAKAWPDSLQGESLKQLWRIDLGEGYPGPIVTEDRVFVAETKDAKEEVVRALDRKSGKQLWETSWKGSMTVSWIGRANGSWIRATPAWDGKRLYVAGIRDVVVCLEGDTGKEVWRADLVERYKSTLPAFGFVCSPIVDDEAVYVQAAGSFIKLDKKTGETKWRILPEANNMYGSAFSSPVITTLGGKKQIVVQTRSTLAGVEQDKGEILWSKKIPADKGMNILTPTIHKDSVFTSAYGTKSFRYEIQKEGDKLEPKEMWALTGDAYMTSPVVINNHAYFLLRNQRLCCLDLEAGKIAWTTPKPFGKYWSMAANKDKILALDQRGILYLIKANPEKFELLDERKITDQETWGHLAVVGDEIFVRELKGIAAYRWNQEKAKDAGK
jgi:outer membrane protein assembly factor BamB